MCKQGYNIILAYLRGWLLNAIWSDEALAEYMYVLSCVCKLVTAALVVLMKAI